MACKLGSTEKQCAQLIAEELIAELREGDGRISREQSAAHVRDGTPLLI
jgi:hypothetical protein